MLVLSLEAETGLKKPLDYTDERLWDSTQAATVAREEYGVRLVKLCCSVCVNGHRSSKCLHYDRPLMMVKERGQRKQASRKGGNEDQDEDSGNKRPHRGNVFLTPVLDPEQPVKYVTEGIPMCPNRRKQITRAACRDPDCCPPVVWGTLHIDMTQFKGFRLLHNQIDKLIPESFGIDVAPYVGGKSDMVSYRKWEDSSRGITRTEQELEDRTKRDVEMSCSSKLAEAVGQRFRFFAERHLPVGDVRPLPVSSSKILRAMMSDINDEMVEEMTELVGGPRCTEVKTAVEKRKNTTPGSDVSRELKKAKKEASTKQHNPPTKPVFNVVKAEAIVTTVTPNLRDDSNMPQDVRVFLHESLNCLPVSRSRRSSVSVETGGNPGAKTTSPDRPIPIPTPLTETESHHEPPVITSPVHNSKVLGSTGQPTDPIQTPYDSDTSALDDQLKFSKLHINGKTLPRSKPRAPSLFIPQDYETCDLSDLAVNPTMTVPEVVDLEHKASLKHEKEEKRIQVLLHLRQKYYQKHGSVDRQTIVQLVKKASIAVSLPFGPTTTDEVIRQLTRKLHGQQRLLEFQSLLNSDTSSPYMGYHWRRPATKAKNSTPIVPNMTPLEFYNGLFDDSESASDPTAMAILDCAFRPYLE